MLNNEFKPPSDFASDKSGSGGGANIWKMLGIGCAVIVLAVGTALAFGAWKTVSCCTDAMVTGGLVRDFAFEVAGELKNEEFDAVYARTSPALAEEISVEQIAAQRGEYAAYFEQASPYISGVNARSDENWEVRVDFAPPNRDQKLVLIMSLDVEGAHSDDASKVLLDSLKFELKTRDLRSEPAAVVVLNFHRALRRDNTDAAYAQVEPLFSEKSAFNVFLEDQKSVFRSGKVEIEAVENRHDFARVTALIRSKQSEQVRVEYELGPSQTNFGEYVIHKITPTYLQKAPQDADAKADAGADEVAEPQSDAGEQGAVEVDTADEDDE